jgi:hypothetical protein
MRGASDGLVSDAYLKAYAGLLPNARMLTIPAAGHAPHLEQPEVFASAAHVIECDVEQNRYVAIPMETRGIVASFHKGREELDIACATQSVHETKNFFARYVQIPEATSASRARRRRRLRAEDVRVRSARSSGLVSPSGNRSSGSRTGARTCCRPVTPLAGSHT